MTVKEFLEQAYIAQQEIDMCLEQITKLQSLATRTTSTLKGTPSGSASATSKIEQALVSIQERKDQLAEEVTELLKITDKVSAAIATIKNPTEKKILKYRYLCFFSWKQIALMMKISESSLFRLHANAIKNFSVVQ